MIQQQLPPKIPLPQPQPLLQPLLEQPQLVAVKSLMIVPPSFFIVYCMHHGLSKFHGFFSFTHITDGYEKYKQYVFEE